LRSRRDNFMDDERYKAFVQKIILDGEHGPYAKATTDRKHCLGTITFLLQPPVWTENRFPEEGSIVVLSELNAKRAGWRANSARFLKPSDEKSVTSTEKREKGDKR
jgi:hypothetical protein